MPQPLPPVRRVLTGHDAQGEAVIIEDRLAPAVRTVAERPGYRVTNLWATFGAPAPINDPDRIPELSGVMPPAKGCLLYTSDAADE